MDMQQVVAQTQTWVSQFVIDYNLCPFAAKPFRENRIRYRVMSRTTLDMHAEMLMQEGHFLFDGSKVWDTTLLIYPEQWTHFQDYLDFTGVMDDCIDKFGWRGDLQLATFHPEYQFAGEDPHGPTHFTNRSPFPMLHLLLEKQVGTAIHNHPNAKLIPGRNKEQMKKLGVQYLNAQLMRWQKLS